MKPAPSPHPKAVTQVIRLTWPDGTRCSGTLRATSAWGAFPVIYDGDTSRLRERIAGYGPNLSLQAMDDLFIAAARETGAELVRDCTGSAPTPYK